MPPHVGAGGGTPAPRKLSDASTTIAKPTWSVTRTTTLLTMFGSTWTHAMRRGDAPTDRAYATNSRSFQLSTSPRTRRANRDQRTSPRIAVTTHRLGPSV